MPSQSREASFSVTEKKSLQSRQNPDAMPFAQQVLEPTAAAMYHLDISVIGQVQMILLVSYLVC